MNEIEKLMRFYLTTSDYTAWYIWCDNLEYLCTPEKKLIDHNHSFTSAWISAKLYVASHERRNVLVRRVGTIFDPHRDLRR
jgi:hypothetical protein